MSNDQQLPAPLTPADCDVSSYEYMPLEGARLRKSRAWLAAKRDPRLGFYMVNLWIAAWEETPAASLENDDDVLADAAMCSPERWPELREQVMRGFRLCSDGRLYHELIACRALEAWLEKLGARISSGAGNAKRYKNEFDDSHLRRQIVSAAKMLFELDPNSRYFTKRTWVLTAILGDKPKKQAKPRKPKDSKPASDGGSGQPPGGSRSGLPGGMGSESHGIALNSTQLDSTPYVGGKPPTTPGADAPGDQGEAVEGGEQQGTKAPLQTRGTPTASIPMADKALVLPDWLKPYAAQWAAFEQIRWKKNGKAPYTLEAQKGILRKLKQFLDEGEDIGELIQNSVDSGWTSVFAKRGATARKPAFTGKNYSGGDLERDFAH